jgi:hypothetical protein
MPDRAKERLSAEEFRQRYLGSPERDRTQMPHSQEHSTALAVDPGRDTGVAWTNAGGRIVTGTCGWWDLQHTLARPDLSNVLKEPVPSSDPDACCVVLEAPYKSRQSIGRKAPIAYDSGRVAREAELLAEWVRQSEYGFIEHDPSRQGEKWDSDRTRRIVGDWTGPDNQHVRDAIRLLFYYSFA